MLAEEGDFGQVKWIRIRNTANGLLEVVVSDGGLQRIEACTGTGLALDKGQLLRVIDAEGGQVADLVCFNRHNVGEWLSNGRSFHYNETLFLTEGHTLYSNRSNAMLKIVEDTVGRHDFLYSPCSAAMFERNYGLKDHSNCLDNLTAALAPFDIGGDTIPTAFNVFMNVGILESGKLEIRHPLSKPGNSVTFRAEMDLAVGVSACSGKRCNAGGTTPIDVEVLGGLE